MTALDWILLAAIALAVLAIALFLFRRKKRTGSALGCCGDCTRCDNCRK